MAESEPLIKRIVFDLTTADQQLDQLEERATRTVTAGGQGVQGGRRGGTTPPPAIGGSAAADIQQMINAAWASGDTAGARRMAASARASNVAVSLPPQAEPGHAARAARV